MNIFEVVLYPITWIMQTTLERTYTLTHSYGIAIILMSLIINTILIPAYMLAESLQSKELRIRNRMQHKLDEFNATFSGMNRFLYIKTLYRIHRYHPIMGLRSLGGVVIQIPFFIAAYQFLGHYELFKQVPFLIIQDLLQPDALLTIGHVQINVLPFVMTAVNLLAADRYTKRTNPKALIQIWGLAFVFLVLLYNTPSALVLYWTMNNVYSWGKNILLMKRHTANKHAEPVVPSTFQVLKAAYIRFLNNKQVVKTTVIAIELLMGYLLASYVLFNSNRARGIIPLQLLDVAMFLGFIQTVLLLTMFLTHIPKNKMWYAITKYSVLVGLIICVGVLMYNVYTPFYSIALSFTIRKIFICVLLVLLHSMLFPWIRVYFRMPPAPIPFARKAHSTVHRYITVCTTLLIPLLLLVALPAEIYTSDPNAIGSPLATLQRILFPSAIVIAMGLFVLYLLTPRVYKLHVSAMFYTIAITVFTYTYLLPFDYGAIHQFTMMMPNSISLKTPAFIAEGILLISVLLLVTHYLSKKQNIFLIVIIGCTIFVLVQFGITEAWYYTPKSHVSPSQNTPEQTTNETPTTYNTSKDPYGTLFKFSKDGKNIVVFLLDMFTGGLMEPILASTPEVTRIYDGFVWYPNALSISTYTTTSKPAMIGGWEYSPENISNIEGTNLAEKIARAYDTMFELYQSQDYAVATSGLTYYGGDNAQCELLRKQDISCLSFWDNPTVAYWMQNNITQKTLASNTAFTIPQRSYLLVATGFIRALPFFAKQFIYDSGEWHIYTPQVLKNIGGYNWAIKNWAFMDSLVGLSSVNSDKNTFKFFHNDVTHLPYALDSSCTIVQDRFPDPSANNNMDGKNAYYSARCAILAIGKWITWLKETGIYDNTKIIIISDHGLERIEDPMNTNAVTLDLMEQTNTKNFSRAHIMFMVKDFNNHGHLKTDNRLVSNADLPAVMCDGLDNCNGIPPSPLLATPAPIRTIPIYHTTFYNWRDLVQDKSFNIKVQYKVTDNIFNKENWRRVK